MSAFQRRRTQAEVDNHLWMLSGGNAGEYTNPKTIKNRKKRERKKRR